MRRYYSVGFLRRVLESLNSIELSQDKEHLCVSVNMRVKFVLNKMWLFVSCSKKILLHVVR